MDRWNLQIGKALLDHAVVLVQPGMMTAAVSFFEDLIGWREDTFRQTGGVWGEARFVAPGEGNCSIQITELKGLPYQEKPLPGIHIGIQVSNPAEASSSIIDWADHAGINAKSEKIPDQNKYFLTIITIFAVEFELVPMLD